MFGKEESVKVRKTLLWDGFVCDADGENLEGLCVGPALGPDKWAVLAVVDDTDGGLNLSRPAVVSFVLDLNAPAPPTTTTRATTSPSP